VFVTSHILSLFEGGGGADFFVKFHWKTASASPENIFSFLRINLCLWPKQMPTVANGTS
jgi:hypothetical protein